ncbi:MAG: restriction endonuclease subunit S [bacterium]
MKLDALPPWVGHLPTSWQAMPLRHLADAANSNVDKKSHEGQQSVRLCNYTDVYYNEYIHDDMNLMEATASPSEILRFDLRAGDVIITKDSETWDDIAVPACVLNDMPDVVCGYHLTMLRPRKSTVVGRFLLRCVQASGIREQFWTAANGVTRFGLGQQGMRDALLPLPPLPTQRAIANFLDRKTAAIDRLIAAKERLIALLAEKRQALITRAVTRGLDPNVPLKDSGIPWLGKIPEHWEVKPLRRVICGLEQGWSPIAEDRLREPGEWGVLKLSAVHNGSFRADEHKTLSADTIPERRYEVKVGDLLVTRANTPALVGDACHVKDAPPKLMLCDLIYRVEVDEGLRKDYLANFLISQVGRDQISAVARGTSQSMVKISQALIKAWIVPIPHACEQEAISSYIEREKARSEKLELTIRDLILKLREYRQTLISAAVTGKIDVRDDGGEAVAI